jgi:hypothetical protein
LSERQPGQSNAKKGQANAPKSDLLLTDGLDGGPNSLEQKPRSVLDGTSVGVRSLVRVGLEKLVDEVTW